MSFFSTWFRFLQTERSKKKARALVADGLTLEALRSVAQLHEKYIEIHLSDGALIKIWPSTNDASARENTKEFW